MGTTTCIKYLVFFFNLLFFFFGIALLGFGIYAELQFGPYMTLSSVNFATGPRILVAVGAIITVIAFFGCCGAWKENKCLLGVFFTLLFILLGLEVAAAVIGYQNRDKIESDLKSDLEKAVKDYPNKNKKALDDLQKDIECCGVNGFQDYILKGFQLPPDSCKCDDKNKEHCQISRFPSRYYNRGCVEGFKKFINDKLFVIGVLAISLLVVQILGMAFAVCLICRIHKEQYA